ncbi:hypothetical protein HJC23_002072 [Cyclotella cryptica]|uniref:Reelin domain-containing protein n=1 Tax=Cyclotella cryptica TaxID=29204 RepID=A0ABD3Q5U5_9STRA|eukprot:CCRYP_008334-RA/>CCRYP_008334-RA protein AED:0.14 eAED:0.12 QI:0/-1/0/1/-1/1/1/0/271
MKQRLVVLWIISLSLFPGDSFIPPSTLRVIRGNLHQFDSPELQLQTHGRTTLSISTSNGDEFEHAGSVEVGKKSIGDVVNNLHGGKYQFQQAEYSLLAGSTRIGQEFAESLYSSSYAGLEEDADEEIPRWVTRVMNPSEHRGKRITDTLIFVPGKGEGIVKHVIRIKNDDRSWERFRVFLFPCNQVAHQGELRSTEYNTYHINTCPFETDQTTGFLAPRGGASNACDANMPYLDSADIVVKWTGDNNPPKTDYLLVVGTEAEVWRYLLKVE